MRPLPTAISVGDYRTHAMSLEVPCANRFSLLNDSDSIAPVSIDSDKPICSIRTEAPKEELPTERKAKSREKAIPVTVLSGSHRALNERQPEPMNVPQPLKVPQPQPLKVPQRQPLKVPQLPTTTLSLQLLDQGIRLVCRHFLKDNRSGTKICNDCEKRGQTNYAFWKNTKHEWQIIRPCKPTEKQYELCRHYSAGRSCIGSKCKFAHGNEELYFWNMVKSQGQYCHLYNLCLDGFKVE